MPNFDKMASRVTAAGLLSLSVQDVRACLLCIQPQRFPIRLSTQVAEHTACFDGIDAPDEKCDADDLDTNTKTIAQSALRMLVFEKPIEPTDSEFDWADALLDYQTREADGFESITRSRTTALRVGANQSLTFQAKQNDISDASTISGNESRGATWENLRIDKKFDVWYCVAQILGSQKKEEKEEAVSDASVISGNEFRPATSKDIAEFFKLLESFPEKDSDFEMFWILYDKFLDGIFDRYYAIAKVQDEDGDDDLWKDYTTADMTPKEVEQVIDSFTAHIFAFPATPTIPSAT